MKIDLAYGNERAFLMVPSGVTVDYITPREIAGFDDIGEAVSRAWAQPVESAPLASMIGATTTVLIVVADLTRSGGTKEVLPALVDHLLALGVRREDIRILVARGTHRRLSKEEKQFFKCGNLAGIPVEEHDCDDGAKMSALLLTRRGTPVRVNRLLKEADRVILLSPVSFHYFAGFGGGRKLVLPGSADRTSILANHRLSLLKTRPVQLHPACRSGNLEGNPVHEDMVEALVALKNVSAMNFFCDTSGRTVYLNAGDPVQSHQETCDVYRSVHTVPVAEPYQLLVASCGGHPYDINFLQAHKALRHASGAAVEGASLLFYAKCPEGVGSESFSRALASPRREFLETAYEQYYLNNQTGVSMIGLTGSHEVAMVTDLDDKTLADAKIERCANAEAFIARALEKHDANRLAVILHGSQVLPLAKRE